MNFVCCALLPPSVPSSPASGRSGSRLPASAPTSTAMPATSEITPSTFARRATRVRLVGQRIDRAQEHARADQQRSPAPASPRAKGSTGETSQSATASSSTPKKRFTLIHPRRRLFGSSAPADTPTSESGTPMPSAIANSAAPPSSTSRRLADVEQRAGERRGDAGADDHRRERAHRRNGSDAAAAQAAVRAVRAAGCRNAGQLQLVAARTSTARAQTKTSANAPSTQAFCSAAASSEPEYAAAHAGGCVRDAPCRARRQIERENARILSESGALADDDPREDRHHRQHAWREGRAAARIRRSSRARAQKLPAGTARAISKSLPGDGRARRGVRLRSAAATARPIAASCTVAFGFHRHVAHADIGAALRGDEQLQRSGAAFAPECGSRPAAIGLHLAEEFVLLALRRAETRARRARRRLRLPARTGTCRGTGSSRRAICVAHLDRVASSARAEKRNALSGSSRSLRGRRRCAASATRRCDRAGSSQPLRRGLLRDPLEVRGKAALDWDCDRSREVRRDGASRIAARAPRSAPRVVLISSGCSSSC